MLKSEGQNQTWNASAQSGYITLAAGDVQKALQQGTQSLVTHD